MALRLAGRHVQTTYACCRASTSAGRLAFPAIIAASAGSSFPSTSRPAPASSASFHTSAPAQEKRKKRIARLKKKTNLSRRVRAVELLHETAPDPIRGYAKKNESVWLASDLRKLILDKEAVWKGEIATLGEGESKSESQSSSVESSSSSNETPTPTPTPHLNFGLSSSDSEFLFKQLPATSAYFETKTTTVDLPAKTLEDRLKVVEPVERNKTDTLRRILDLRNANSRGIRFENTKRIVEHFSDQSRKDENGNVKPDPGRSEVQAALLTMRIHNLADHLTSMPRDIHCRRSLRALIMARARHLRYLKRSSLERYVSCLKAIGVEQRAVEGEIVLKKSDFRL